VQPRLVGLIAHDLDFAAAKAGEALIAFNGRFLGAPKAAECQFVVWLAQAPGDLSAREILDIEGL
jgi:hypothetical protein